MKGIFKARDILAALIFILLFIILLRIDAKVDENRATVDASEAVTEEAVITPEPVSAAEPVVEAEPTVVVKYIPVEVEADQHEAEMEELERWRSGYYKSVPLTTEDQDALHAACDENGIEFNLALAVIFVETNFQNLHGDGGKAYGYMQIQERFHRERMDRLGVTDLMDAESNFRVGCDILNELITAYGITGGLTAYNTGHSGSSAYAEKVITQYQYFNSWEGATK